jgi:hypothetical protein
MSSSKSKRIKKLLLSIRSRLPFKAKPTSQISPLTFSYQPLKDSSSETRLLTLLPGRFEDEIRCTLRHVDLTAKPEYEALFYVWGNPKITLPIKLAYDVMLPRPSELPIDRIFNVPEEQFQFHDFQVTTNLESALRHLRHESIGRTMWIDAICINQNDIPEREQLVRKMGSIYKDASRVAVWLGDYGDEDEDSEDEDSSEGDREGEESDNDRPASMTSRSHAQPPKSSSEEAISRAFEYMHQLDEQFKSSGIDYFKAPIDATSIQAIEDVIPGLKIISRRR